MATAYTDDSYAFGCQTQEASIVMLKNVDNTIKAASTPKERPSPVMPQSVTMKPSKLLFRKR
mgnify:CR=1 FL=1